MNLQDVLVANPTGAKTAIVVKAKLVEVVETSKTLKGKPKQTILVADSSGQRKLTLYPGQVPHTTNDLGKYFDYKVWCNNYQGNIYLQAFLDSPEPVKPAPQQAEAADKAVTSQGNERLRSMCLSYAKDLAVAGKIELGAINGFADEFLAYIENRPVREVQSVTNLPDEEIPWIQ